MNERDVWRQAFENGSKPDFLVTYKENRDSELWRSGSIVEELAEYILYLEGLLND
jgi:hypothetical protein